MACVVFKEIIQHTTSMEFAFKYLATLHSVDMSVKSKFVPGNNCPASKLQDAEVCCQ